MEHDNDSEIESRERIAHAPQNSLAPCRTNNNAEVDVPSSTNDRSSNPPRSSNLNLNTPSTPIHQGNRHGSIGSTEVAASNSDAFRRSNNTSSQSFNRLSPYDTMTSDSVTIDDETIDAAVVEEIIDDGNNVVPALLSQDVGPLTSTIDYERDINNTTNNININVSTEALLIPNAVSNHIVIPEVEPEVDIEEIHVINDRNVSTISALTNTSLSVLDQQDTKEPPSAPRVAAATATMPSNDLGGERVERPQHHDQRLSYSPYATTGFAAMPPPVPQRAFTSDYRGYSTGTTSSIPPAVPIFKSMMMHPRQSSSDHTTNTMAQHTSQDDELPDYKDQARPKMPASVPINSRNVSNNSSGTDNTPNNTQNGSGSNHYSNGVPHSIQHHSDDEHIPVVSAILVPAERLAAEERLEEQWLQQQHRYSHQTRTPGQSGTNSQLSNSNVSSGESTLTTSHTSSNNDNQHPTSQNNESRNETSTQRTKSSDQLNSDNVPPPMSERRFWMTIILTALILNSLLVAGAVVGGFCAAGKCTGSKTNDLVNVQPSIPEMNITTNVPSQSPSIRLLSIVPTLENSGSRFDNIPTPVTAKIGTTQPAFESFTITQSPSNLNSNAPALAGFTTVETITPTFTTSGNDTFSDFAPSKNQNTSAPESDDTFTIGTETTVPVDTATSVPSYPTLSPTAVASNISGGIPQVPATEIGNIGTIENDRNDVSLALLVPLVLGIEAMIIVGLVCYYRQWKRHRAKQLLHSDYDTLPSSPATDAGTPVTNPNNQQQQLLGGNTSSSTGSSTSNDRYVFNDQLPTISECNSVDTHPSEGLYSV